MRKIDLFKVFMSPEAPEEVTKVLQSGFIGQGPKVDELESKLKEYFGVRYLLAVNSGTSAEHLSWMLLKRPNPDSNWAGLQPGDEVLCTPLTCTASNWPVVLAGLKIKWVDIDPTTLNMDLDDLERKITPKTKAIQLVHWGGYPNDLDRIAKIQEKTQEAMGFKPVVLEDCAHAFGSKFNNRFIGTHGNIATFSLQAIKHITSVDGGFITIPHHDLWKRGDLLKWYGIDRRSPRVDFRCEADITEIGTKWHMNDVCAAVGLANLKYADTIISKHKNNAAFYDQTLSNIHGLTTLTRHDNRESAFWIYSLLVEDRSSFTKWMNECGIAVSQVHERNDKHTCVKEFRTHLPNLDKVVGNLTHIPVGWWVSEEDREYIVECIKKGW